MASVTKRWDIVAARKYTTSNGEEKKQWINVGRATEWDGEQISLELNALPVFPGWDGRLSLFTPKENGQPPPKQAPRARKAEPAGEFEDSDIPF